MFAYSLDGACTPKDATTARQTPDLATARLSGHAPLARSESPSCSTGDLLHSRRGTPQLRLAHRDPVVAGPGDFVIEPLQV
jgi:hypothetical protein